MQPPFANEQTNQEATANGQPSSACARTRKRYMLHSGAWISGAGHDRQLRARSALSVAVRAGVEYRCAEDAALGHCDERRVQRVEGQSSGHHERAARDARAARYTNPTNLVFNYDQALAFSKFNAGTLRVNKRLTKGFAVGANYQYSHSIDDASSVGTQRGVGAQNWQNLNAEEGNSSLDHRHKVSGTYLYELPFGKDKILVYQRSGLAHFGGIFGFGELHVCDGNAAQSVLCCEVSSVACGTARYTLRPNLSPGVSVTAGGGSLKQWFNPGAFSSLAAMRAIHARYLAMRRATRSQGRGRFRTTWRFRRRCSLGIRGAWRFAPR